MENIILRRIWMLVITLALLFGGFGHSEVNALVLRTQNLSKIIEKSGKFAVVKIKSGKKLDTATYIYEVEHIERSIGLNDIGKFCSNMPLTVGQSYFLLRHPNPHDRNNEGNSSTRCFEIDAPFFDGFLSKEVMEIVTIPTSAEENEWLKIYSDRYGEKGECQLQIKAYAEGDSPNSRISIAKYDLINLRCINFGNF